MTDPPRTPARVTVITPAHNAAAHLAQALESVVAQRYEDWEAVVVDDASDDDTFAIATSFAERHPGRIHAIRLDRNVGPAEARNRGLAATAGGELVAMLDADDHWRPDYLEHQVSAFDGAVAAGGRPGVMACNAFVETPDGPVGTYDELFFWADRVDQDKMLERNYVMVSAMFTRAAFEEVGGFSPECWGTEDYDLWLRMIEAGYEVVTTREPLAVYREHPGGLSKNLLTMADAGIAVFTRALRRDAMTPHQRRLARKGLRHFRAVRAFATIQTAIRQRAPLKALLLAVKAIPLGAVALLQAPSRWGEWLRLLLHGGPARSSRA